VTGAELDAIRVYGFDVAWIDYDQGVEHFEEWKATACRQARAELHRVIDEVVAGLGPSVAPPAVREVHALVLEGNPAHVLLDLAKEADLLVVGSRGRGQLGGVLVGSVSQRCIERSPCPTVVVTGESAVSRIVVGVDGSESAQSALVWAVEEAAATGATVDAVCAYPSTIVVSPHPSVPTIPTEKFRRDAGRILDEAILRVGAVPGLTIRPVVSAGRPAEVLTACAVGADLVVMGTRGRGAVKGLVLGSVTHQVMRRVHCPVVVVPAPSRAELALTVS
jgi:nucleotide-binding universal stress UspA family protein